MNLFAKVVAGAIEGISLSNVYVAEIGNLCESSAETLRIPFATDSTEYRLLKHTSTCKTVIEIPGG